MEARELLDRYEIVGGEDVYAEARERYEAALAETPDDATLMRDYAYLLECHGRRTLMAAVDTYARARALAPDELTIRLQLTHTLAAIGRQDEAVADAERWLAERPGDPAAHRCLAYAHLCARDFAAAAGAISAGLALAPDDAGLAELDGDVHAATGDPEAALERWERALALDTENLGPRYSAASLLEREGRPAEAAEQWRAIVAWCEARGYELDADWPRRELARLRA